MQITGGLSPVVSPSPAGFGPSAGEIAQPGDLISKGYTGNNIDRPLKCLLAKMDSHEAQRYASEAIRKGPRRNSPSNVGPFWRLNHQGAGGGVASESTRT